MVRMGRRVVSKNGAEKGGFYRQLEERHDSPLPSKADFERRTMGAGGRQIPGITQRETLGLTCR